MSAEPRTWKVTLPCTRAEAEAVGADLIPLTLLDPLPVLMTSEPDPARPENWRLDAYFGEEPDAALLALIVSLVPSFTGPAPGASDDPSLPRRGARAARAPAPA